MAPRCVTTRSLRSAFWIIERNLINNRIEFLHLRLSDGISLSPDNASGIVWALDFRPGYCSQYGSLQGGGAKTNTNVQWTRLTAWRIVMSGVQEGASWNVLSCPWLMTTSPSASRCPTCCGNSAFRPELFHQPKSFSLPIVCTRHGASSSMYLCREWPARTFSRNWRFASNISRSCSWPVRKMKPSAHKCSNKVRWSVCSSHSATPLCLMPSTRHFRWNEGPLDRFWRVQWH